MPISFHLCLSHFVKCFCSSVILANLDGVPSADIVFVHPWRSTQHGVDGAYTGDAVELLLLFQGPKKCMYLMEAAIARPEVFLYWLGV